MKKLLPIFISLCMSTSVDADDVYKPLHPAIKVENPNQLAHFVSVGKDCPLARDDLTQLVDGIFIRSRIKPLSNRLFVANSIYLNVAVHCYKIDPDYSAFSIDVKFGRNEPYPPVLFDFPFGVVGTGGKEYLLNAVKVQVELAITEYLKANFDL